MKSQSLISQLSSLSHLSNVSYHGQKKDYKGTQFFKESLPFGYYDKISSKQLKQQQIDIDSLGVSNFRNFTPVKDNVNPYAPYWTAELNHNIEGTSDNEEQSDVQLLNKQIQKIQEIQQPKQSEHESEQVSTEKRHQQNSGLHQQQEKVLKNETKNIPKNYGKAIIIFVEKNRQLIEVILNENGDNYTQLLHRLKNLKKKINTISDLRNLWQSQPESRSLRIISNLFLRKYSLHYIYNSRIKTRLCHAKYKRRLQEAILNPKQFNHIKNY